MGNDRAVLMASIVPEKPGTSVQIASAGKQREVYTFLERILKEVGPNLRVEVRFVSNLNNMRTGVPCKGAEALVLEIDPRMYEDLKQMGDRALTFVLAHEVSHFLQYLADSELVYRLCQKQTVERRVYELLADFSAGHIANALQRGDSDFRLLEVLARLADYDFTNVEHHGTTTQRMAAQGLGAFANHHGKPLDMARLLTKKRKFEEVLFVGAPQPTFEAQQKVYLQSLEALYQ
jgi:hypothetical protein